MVKNLPANAGALGSIPGPGRSHTPWSNKVRVSQPLKPACLSSVTREAHILHLLPFAANREKPGQQQKLRNYTFCYKTALPYYYYYIFGKQSLYIDVILPTYVCRSFGRKANVSYLFLSASWSHFQKDNSNVVLIGWTEFGMPHSDGIYCWGLNMAQVNCKDSINPIGPINLAWPK